MLTTESYESRSSRDHRYYELLKTHFDVMRFTDQITGQPILDDEQQITGYKPGKMVWCVAFGPRIKGEVLADSGSVVNSTTADVPTTDTGTESAA